MENIIKFKKAMVEEGMEDILKLITNQAIAEVISSKVDFVKSLSDKIIYSLKVESPGKEDKTELMIKAIKGHADYLVMLKKYKHEIDVRIFDLAIKAANEIYDK